MGEGNGSVHERKEADSAQRRGSDQNVDDKEELPPKVCKNRGP